MRVMQVNKLFYPHIGGVEQVVYDLATGIKPYVEKSMVLVCNEKKRTMKEAIDGIEIFRVGTLGTYFSMPVSPGFPFWLRKLSKQTDVYHFHYPFPLGDISYLLSGTRVPAVLTWHSEIVRQQRLLRGYLPALKIFLRRAQKIIVTSPQLLAHSEILSPFQSKCVIVPLGIDIGKHQLQLGDNLRVQQLRSQFQERPIVLFVGRLVYYKGIEILVKAMHEIPDAILFVVGTGPLETKCRDLVEELEIKQRVVFFGSIPDANLRILYHACDLFVLPSIERSEAFGLVQLEAMSCGKPVISSNLPTGVPFVNQHLETGYVVPPGDVSAMATAIEEILSDDGLRHRYGENARQRATRYFSRETMVDHIKDIYDSL